MANVHFGICLSFSLCVIFFDEDTIETPPTPGQSSYINLKVSVFIINNIL